MPSQSLLQILGSRGTKEARYAPIFTDRFFVGLWTNRNPLRSPLSTFYADGWHLGGTDALIAGQNIELSPRLTLCRRPGNVVYSTATIPEAPDTFYSFKMFGGSVVVIVDTIDYVYTLTPTTLTAILTKSAPGQSNFLGIGATLYIGSSQSVPLAWQNNGIRNWGVSIGPFSNAVGPDTAGTGAQLFTGQAWATPSNITTGGASYATVTLPGGGGSVTSATVTNHGNGYTVASVSIVGGGGSGATGIANVGAGHVLSITITNGGSGYTSAPTVNISGSGSGATATAGITTAGTVLNAQSLVGTNYGITIPSGNNVTGVSLVLNIGVTISGGTASISYPVQLIYQNQLIGSAEMLSVIADGTVRMVTAGSTSDGWNASLASAIVSDSTFGFALTPSITVLTGTPSIAFQVNGYSITIYGTGGPTVSLTTGTLTATVGYEYVVAYGNSASGDVSNATPPSQLIKPTAQGVQVDLVASTDPQVNQIWVFRTADGGSTFLNLPTSPYPNVTANVVDNALDGQLSITQQAAVVLENTPPPTGATDPVLYLGLVWVHVGNVVYFTRVTSAVVGNTYEDFPPANVFAFPETVIRKIPINAGLLVFTTSNIYIILGQNTSSSVLYSSPFLASYGILSWNALWIDGSIIYFFTADHRLIRLDPSSGVEDMGFPIGNLLASVDPASAYVTYHSSTSNDTGLYLGDGSTGWYRCNPNQAPDGAITGPVWSPKANIAGGCKALVAMEPILGTHQLMMGGTSTNEPVLVRDSSYSTFTDNGTAYAANFTIGSIVLAQPGQAAIMRFLTAEFVKTGTSPTVSVLLNEISGTFENISGYIVNDPPYLAAPSSLISNRYYFKQTVAGGAPDPAICRHLQIEVDYGSTDTVQNEILSMTINGAHYAER